MSALQYPISDTNPVRIAAGLQGALTLYNESTTNVIYVSEYPDNNGFPITPGMTLSWDAAKPLYAYVAANAAATLDVVDNGGQISSPAAIASQILGQGLAQQIAQQISLTGVPVIDSPTVLWDNTATQSSQISPFLDVSKYQSISIFIIEKQTSGADPSPPGINSTLIRSVFCDFADSALGTLPPALQSYDGSYLGGGSEGTSTVPQFVANLPVVGNRFHLTVNGTDTGIASLTSHILIIGSYRTLAKASISTWNVYQTHDAQFSGIAQSGCIQWAVGSWAANQTYLALPPTIAGPCRITVYVGPAVASPGMSVYMKDSTNGAFLFAILKTTTTGYYTFDIVMPANPVQLTVANNTGAPVTSDIISVGFLYDIR